ncbi:gamma-glutamylcyclotransferase [Castellaniella sp.]|uniref:gamma-glutamylcyclotransferase n=1 Tax=Castellaniella sp. TaxID=1955812 RepID=UPI0035695837
MPTGRFPAPPTPETLHLRDAAWHERSIAQALDHWDGRTDLWVFGYGSLVWRPEFEYLEARLAQIHGYHRALCMWSRVNRGTPEHPGLVFSLDHGGLCRGRAYRIAADHVPQTMRALWAREMPSGSYIPRWLPCKTPNGPLSALVFTMDRSDPSYVPGLSIEQILGIVRTSRGRYGPCSEYVLQTAQALEAAGILDPELDAIARALQAPSSETL